MYNYVIEKTNPDFGVHGSCQIIHEEGVYTGAKKLRSVDFMPTALYKLIQIHFYHQGTLW